MAGMDKNYVSAIKAGVIGVVLIIICGAFALYMYERDQYNYWHSDAPMYYDNFCVGVFWIPFFLMALAIIATFTGGLSVRLAGGVVKSSRDAVLVSALSGFIAGGINIALLTAGLLWKALNSTEDNNFSDTFFLMNLLMSAFYLLGYLMVHTFLSMLGGIMQWIRKSKT